MEEVRQKVSAILLWDQAFVVDFVLCAATHWLGFGRGSSHEVEILICIEQ